MSACQKIYLKLSIKSPSLWPPNTYPLFQWYPQNKEILLNLSMKCWNLAFDAQGSRVIINIVQVGAVKKYVAGVKALRKEGMKPPKLVEKLVWVPVISFCKVQFPIMHWCPTMPKLAVLAP